MKSHSFSTRAHYSLLATLELYLDVCLDQRDIYFVTTEINHIRACFSLAKTV